MRGKLKARLIAIALERITPADAGKTVFGFSFPLFDRDHPRGCGENYDGCCMLTEPVGSPPRMRGKQEKLCEGANAIRITPADAGKTCTEICREYTRKDHPRGCGENFFSVSFA